MLVTLLIINCVVAVLNTFLLIAIAGTTAKMLRYSAKEEEPLAPSRGLTELPRLPSYADLAVHHDGLRPLPPNFDGLNIIDRS